MYYYEETRNAVSKHIIYAEDEDYEHRKNIQPAKEKENCCLLRK